jgi:hypothetical protein
MARAAYSSDFANGTFPSPILPKEELNKPETGLQVARAIYETSIYGANSYFSIRNNLFAERRVFASGKQPIQTYLDLLGVDGKNSYANFSYHPRPIAPKFRAILVNDIMAKMEQVDCTALSQYIQQRKDDRKNEMAFKMHHGDFIQAAEKSSGMKFSDNGEDFVPETEEELDLWGELNNKEKEEELMSFGIDFILYNNDKEAIKKEVAENIVDTGMACEWTYFDARKRIRVKSIRPEYMGHSSTLTLDGRDNTYYFHLDRMALVDVRAMWPDIKEEKIYEWAYQFRGLYGNPDQLVDFIVDFDLAYTRPYDSWLVDVLFFRYKCIKEIDYSKGKDIYGNNIVEWRKIKDNPKKENFKAQIPTWYDGAWLIGAEEVLEWGEMENLIRNNEDVEDVMPGYAVYMLNNNGDMLPMSPVEYMRPSIIQADLAMLRLQNVLSVTPPPGFKMDIDAFLDLNLGTGLQKVGPLKIAEMYQQTGRVYYSGTKISGDRANQNPLEQLQSSYGDMVDNQIKIYDFEIQNIYDYLGSNKVKDGSEVPERIGANVAQGAAQAANMSTAHIYGGVVSIRERTVKACGIMLWDALANPGTNEMYIKLLGQQNADFIRYNKELTKSNYLTKITVNSSGEDLSWLYKMLDTAVQQKALMPVDAMMVKKYAQFNYEYAVRYLNFMETKRAKQAAQAQQAQAQQQQQATMDLQKQQAADKLKSEQASDKRAMIKETTKINGEHTLLIQQLINAALLEEQKEGKPIPSYVQIAINKQLQAHVLETEQQIQAMEEQLQQHDLEVMSQAQQQQMQQQQGQQGQAQPQGQPQAA